MKYIFWILIGIVCGAALGIILPVGAFLLMYLLEGERVKEGGTVFAIMMILTVPAGALFGAYAGIHRARSGGWKGLMSPTIGSTVTDLREVASLERQIHQFSNEVATIPEDQGPSAKLDYLQYLEHQYESASFNYPLFGFWLLAGFAMPFLLIVPASMVFRHYKLRASLRSQIQDLTDRWLGEAQPER
jgi:hypothetical protein